MHLVLALVLAMPLQVLKATLDLDDQQVAQLQQMIQTREAAIGAAQRQAEGFRTQLESALSQPNPDAAAVGALVISIRGVEKQIAQHQADFRNAFLGILSDEQIQRVESFRFIRAAFMGGTALDELGL